MHKLYHGSLQNNGVQGGPHPDRIAREGNDYLVREFSALDHIRRATLVEG